MLKQVRHIASEGLDLGLPLRGQTALALAISLGKVPPVKIPINSLNILTLGRNGARVIERDDEAEKCDEKHKRLLCR